MVLGHDVDLSRSGLSESAYSMTSSNVRVLRGVDIVAGLVYREAYRSPAGNHSVAPNAASVGVRQQRNGWLSVRQYQLAASPSQESDMDKEKSE